MGAQRKHFTPSSSRRPCVAPRPGTPRCSTWRASSGSEPTACASGSRRPRESPAPTPGRGRGVAPLSLDEEVRQLRRENAQLREERDILKKAAAFFARESR